MRNINQQQQQVSKLLAIELKETQQLMDILNEEHQALSHSDPDRIAAISSKKLNAMEKIEQCHTQLTGYLTQIGIASSSDEIELFIQRLPKEHLIAMQWRELQELIKKLHHQNEVNGGIITLSQRHVTSAMDILSGKANNASTYGRTGQTNSEATPQHLAKA